MLPVAFIAVSLSSVPIPPECELPEQRDVLPLKQLAQLDGALSVGLDSVATWCFDPGGSWTGGVPPTPGKGKTRGNILAPATGDCAKAIASCEASLKGADKPALRELAGNALNDLERPYRTGKYLPKRAGLKDKPNDKADCLSRERSELFAQAQARMDIARLTSQIQSEYSAYKAWLMQESLKCRNEVVTAKKGAKDNTRLAVDSTKPPEPAPKAEPAAPPKADPPPKISATTTSVTSTETAAVKAEPPPTSWVTERETALSKPMLDKWRYLADQVARQETDRDYTLGFLASRELRACDCTRVNPGAIVRSLEKREGGASGMALLQSEDGANTRCTVCSLDAFAAWRPRVDKQCKQMDQLTDFELEKLAQSDDANGIPPRCMEDTRKKRAEAKRVVEEQQKRVADEAARVAATNAQTQQVKAQAAAVAANRPAPDAGTAVAAASPKPAGPQLTALPAPPQPAPAPAQPAPAPAPTPAPTPAAQAGNPNLVTVNGMTYYRPAGSDAGLPPAAATAAVGGASPYVAPTDAGARSNPPGLTGPGVPVATANPADNFVPPEAWAPIPVREEGRMYVRLSMSSACVAEIFPGPIQARTGDLLLVPFGANNLSVRSPCGGLAEIYWGKEARPRFSEVFGRNQAIKFEFKNQ
ncbi:MAG: hypothetical protein IPJ65_43045 [Archangiaceae bacterium]|nr:hypothetical protein [Archangiaceae bacterium]